MADSNGEIVVQALTTVSESGTSEWEEIPENETPLQMRTGDVGRAQWREVLINIHGVTGNPNAFFEVQTSEDRRGGFLTAQDQDGPISNATDVPTQRHIPFGTRRRYWRLAWTFPSGAVILEPQISVTFSATLVSPEEELWQANGRPAKPRRDVAPANDRTAKPRRDLPPAVLNRLGLRNLTVFQQADLTFAPHLNIIVGENGTGKTHLLKIVYSTIAVSNELAKRFPDSNPTKVQLQGRLADKLVTVFRSEALGRLASRRLGQARCDIQLHFENPENDIAFTFATNSKSEVSVEAAPRKWIDTSAAYIPTRELLTIFPNFVSVYEGHYLEFEETWRDTCVLLGEPPRRGPRDGRIRELLQPLEEAMGGSVVLDKNGRFYLNPTGSQTRIEMPLVAEGHRKLAMLCQLIAAGAFANGGFLFWDEPEANLNPQLVRSVALSIAALSTSGIQTFIATHSLFLLRELDIIRATTYGDRLQTRYFGLHRSDNGVSVLESSSIDEVGDIASLDEELRQSDRYLEQVP